ncbi:sigma-70 family RNA polymerase sigma factor [Streptomyces cyaneofuscatus]|uniref:hypothetical protein n=1 Tax=Streptomyces cyaneofuscatus TaxID=66883 RepID=UPI003629D7C5
MNNTTDTLTIDQVYAAQANDLGAIGAVLDAMQGRINSLADIAARRMTENGMRFDEHRDDLRQDAALAMFEALPRFVGNDVDTFFGFMWSTIEETLKDKVRAIRNPGVDKDAVKVFAAMLEKAGGDLYVAEKFAQTVPPKGRRLSADRAAAARMTWVGPKSLDAPARSTLYSYEDDSQVACTRSLEAELAATLGVPDDLVTSADLSAEERREKIAMVNGILDTLSPQQRAVVRHSFGIGGDTCYGYGDESDNEGMAAELGMKPAHVPPARTKGMRNFAAKWIEATAYDDEEAAMLTAVAQQRLTNGGRK